jgi:predicted nucleic acid-binding protein
VIVLDSSFLIGFYNLRDAHHTKAASLMSEFLDGRWGKGLLLEYVYLEVVTVLLMRADAAVAVKAGGDLLESREFEFVPCSELFAETVKSFTAQQQTKLSFTDIAIATVALKRSDGLVLTFDEEFRKLPAIRLAE